MIYLSDIFIYHIRNAVWLKVSKYFSSKGMPGYSLAAEPAIDHERTKP
jgi:hypothetical protein